MSSSTDFVVREIDKLLSRPHQEDDKMKSSSNLFFQFRHVYSTLIDSQKELLEQRERSIAQLKQSTKEVKSLKIKFCTDLRLIDEELSEVHSQSKDLSESCSKLSVDFTQITDRLDVATSLVRKADTISTYIQNIQIFGSDSDLDSVLTKLKNTTFPLNDQFKTAEYLSKLIKIIDISEKKANIECARINLESYRTRLSQELLRTFKDKLTSAHSTPEELHNYARSLSYLQLGHETIRAYIDMSPVFTEERCINLHFNEEILKHSFNEIYDHYDKFCGSISDECTKVWNKIDIIFDPTQQVKLKLLQSIFDRLLSTFVSEVLSFYAHNKPLDFCLMLEKFYRRTTVMLESIFRLDSQQYATLNLMDRVFREYQSEYSIQERFVLNDSMKQLIRGPISLLDKFESQNLLTRILQKNEESIDPFKIFDETICSQILSIASSTWERCALLSLPENIEEDLQNIMECFLNNTFYVYNIRFIKCCSQYLSISEDCNYVGMFLKMLLMVNSSILTLDDKYTKSLKGILFHHSIAHSKFNVSRKEFIRKLEMEISEGLSNCVEVIAINAKNILLNLQKKIDFLPAKEIEPLRTNACQSFVEFLRNLINETRSNIAGENKISFYTAVGRRLINVIREHLLQFKYNSFGILILNIDTNEYKNVFELFQIKELNEEIEAIHSCTSLMMMDINGMLRTDNDKDKAELKNIIPKEYADFAKKLLSMNVDMKSSDIDAFFKKFIK